MEARLEGALGPSSLCKLTEGLHFTVRREKAMLGIVAHACIPVSSKKQEHYCQFEVSLVYIVAPGQSGLHSMTLS